MNTEFKTKLANYWTQTCTWTKSTWGELKVREWSQKDFAIMFCLAFIVGMVGKSVARETFTIGYEDYVVEEEEIVDSLPVPSIAKGLICEE
jgi:hypothetical protein